MGCFQNVYRVIFSFEHRIIIFLTLKLLLSLTQTKPYRSQSVFGGLWNWSQVCQFVCVSPYAVCRKATFVLLLNYHRKHFYIVNTPHNWHTASNMEYFALEMESHYIYLFIVPYFYQRSTSEKQKAERWTYNYAGH